MAAEAYDDYEDDFESDGEEAEQGGGRPVPAPGRAERHDEAKTHDTVPRASEWTLIRPDEVEIGAQIGGGGFALVHRGRWKGKNVAVKVLFDPNVSEELKQEFMDEVLAMSALDHPNIVRLLGACTVPPRMCFVMELCGQSVFHLLHATRARLHRKQLVSIALDAARALQYLHALRPAVVHRDLKTHNLLVGVDGRVRLCDFGLVATRARTAGTPNYMAPELLRSSGTFSKQVDVYAFGIVLWEIFSRRVPFDGDDPESISSKVCGGERPSLSDAAGEAPSELLSLMQQCWAQDPSARPTFEAILPVVQQAYDDTPEPSLAHVSAKAGGDALDSLLARK